MAVMFMFNMFYQDIFNRHELDLDNECTESVEKIVAFVPAYKETFEQLSKTVDSLICSKLGSKYLMVCVVSDGENDYESLIQRKFISRMCTYKSWKGNEVRVVINYGIRNDKHIIVINKYQNNGKKDSIVLCNDIFNYKRDNLTTENENFRSMIQTDILNLFNISDFDYIFSTDADTVVDELAMSYLVDTIKRKNAVASCGIVNVDFSSCNVFWNNIQNFQYLYGQYLRRTNEDLFNQVLCLPGCISMFKIRESGNDLKLYSELVDEKNFVQSCVQYVGTDRRYTSSLIYTENSRIVLDKRSQAYTVPPDNISSFIKQRKRWSQNTYFNTMLNIISPNVNVVLRLFNLIDYLRLSLVYFRFFNTVYFIYLLSAFYEQKDINGLIPYIVILTYPVFVFFFYALFNAHLRKQYFRLFFSLLVNRVFVFVSSVVIFTIMMYDIGSCSWNGNESNVREIVIEEEIPATEVVNE
jgi:chitin synthase